MTETKVQGTSLPWLEQFISDLPSSGMAVADPFDCSHIAYVPDAEPMDAEQCLQQGSTALPSWTALTYRARAKKLERWYSLIRKHKQELGTLLSREQGKPLSEAIGEVMYGASFIQWFAQEAVRSYGRIIPNQRQDHRSEVLPEAIGLCVAITPWNFPNAMITRKVAPALAAGCTIILKPAEQTPLSALALHRLAMEAGIPAAVFQIITTSNPSSIGARLCLHPAVRKISFTGSTEVGRIIMGHAAKGIKKVGLELGGNAPFIIFEDADIEAAVDGLMKAKFRNSGQTCISANRVFVQSTVYEQVIDTLILKVRALSCGRGLDNPDIGPLIDKDALDKVRRLVDDAKNQGARLHCGGELHAEHSHIYLPTVLSEVTDAMSIAQEEIFGPVVALYRFEDEAEVIRRSNDIPHGLSAYFYARDHARIHRVSKVLESGMVGVNTGFISDASAPFGGVKQSGIGREGAIEGLQEYQEHKYICTGGLS